MRAEAQHLGNRTNQIDLIGPHEEQDGGRAKDEHRGDDRRGDQNRPANRPHGVATFAGDDGDVLEAAEGAEAHLAEEIQIEQRERGHRERERRRRRRDTVRSSRSAAPRAREQHQNQHAAGVQPFADAETTAETITSPATIAQAATVIIGRLAAIHDALGPSAYDRYVVTCSPISDVLTMTYSQRFHATRKPAIGPMPSFVH